jgi:MFS family permease
MRSRAAAAVPVQSRVYPRSRFLLQFLMPFALWHLATGAFNPFNNVYFARLKFSVQEIGNVFSASQVLQVIAVLFAPFILRRFGLVHGIVWMMAATAASLGALALQPEAFAAVMAYGFYMSAQWMSEPGLNTLLMNHVGEHERSGASAVAYLVAFGAQAAAAYAAGQCIERFGYEVVLLTAALVALSASALFGRLRA